MITIEMWTAQNARNPKGRLVTRATTSQAFDYATAEGAYRIIDQFGAVYRWLESEWVQIR